MIEKNNYFSTTEFKFQNQSIQTNHVIDLVKILGAEGFNKICENGVLPKSLCEFDCKIKQTLHNLNSENIIDLLESSFNNSSLPATPNIPIEVVIDLFRYRIVENLCDKSLLKSHIGPKHLSYGYRHYHGDKEFIKHNFEYINNKSESKDISDNSILITNHSKEVADIIIKVVDNKNY